MILPSKHLSQDRALLTVGARILQHLHRPKTVSALWEELLEGGEGKPNSTFVLSYNWYVLALDLLFLIGAIDMEEGLLARKIGAETRTLLTWKRVNLSGRYRRYVKMIELVKLRHVKLRHVNLRVEQR